ncbi:MAG TPA: hypothetical protein VGO50_10805 [Pyrinomonadaceae bacterium]|jgi:hypothetical protein|nr:hypothetical protein [Pyrinomonadaceae bacterium]
MEIFDADNDGIYELVQWDSAFRYFMDDCGSCSPTPRAVFKYDKTAGVYRPAKGLQQDFAKESFEKTAKKLAADFERIKKGDDPGLEVQFYRDMDAHIADTFYLGEDEKAWQLLNKYYSGPEKKKVRAAFQERLDRSKFYRALKQIN